MLVNGKLEDTTTFSRKKDHFVPLNVRLGWPQKSIWEEKTLSYGGNQSMIPRLFSALPTYCVDCASSPPNLKIKNVKVKVSRDKPRWPKGFR
jgi:hypothetical protein